MRARLVEFLAGGMFYNGEPLASGTVETYDAGTSTPRSLYQDMAKASAHANPATLNAQGALQAYGDGNYKFIIKDADGNTRYTYDNVPLFENDGIQNFVGLTTGAANTYVGSASPSPAELVEGLVLCFEAHQTNTNTTPTFNPNSLGATTIKRLDESALFVGDIVSGNRYYVVYDDSAWLLINPSSGWQSWTPTLTGFSANPANAVYRYRVIGKTCQAFVHQGTTGTSNSTSFSISAPLTAATVTNAIWGTTSFLAYDNGSVLTAPAVAQISSAASSIVCVVAHGSGAASWTNVNGKAISFMLTYEIA